MKIEAKNIVLLILIFAVAFFWWRDHSRLADELDLVIKERNEKIDSIRRASEELIKDIKTQENEIKTDEEILRDLEDLGAPSGNYTRRELDSLWSRYRTDSADSL